MTAGRVSELWRYRELLFFLAWLVAFVLEPFVGALVESRLPRLAAIGLTYLTLLVVLVAGVILHKLGMTGSQAVECIRQRRPGALFNEVFAQYLLSLPNALNDARVRRAP